MVTHIQKINYIYIHVFLYMLDFGKSPLPLSPSLDENNMLLIIHLIYDIYYTQI